MSQMTSLDVTVAPEDVDRAMLYGFVGRLLQAPPSDEDLGTLREMGSGLADDKTEIGAALKKLSDVASSEDAEAARRAYHDLFIGIGRGELVPYGSFYLTGFLNEKPLAELRGTMAQLGIKRAEGVKEPEDHIAALMQMMEGLISGQLWQGGPLPLEAQKAFFTGHIGSWAPYFFKDLAQQETSAFYAALGELGRALIAVETEAFDMTP